MKLIHIQRIPNYTNLLIDVVGTCLRAHVYVCMHVRAYNNYLYVHMRVYVYGGGDINVILDGNLAVVSVSQ